MKRPPVHAGAVSSDPGRTREAPSCVVAAPQHQDVLSLPAPDGETIKASSLGQSSCPGRIFETLVKLGGEVAEGGISEAVPGVGSRCIQTPEGAGVGPATSSSVAVGECFKFSMLQGRA